MVAEKVEKEAAGQLLDAMYLDLFHLIEEHTQCKVNLERANASGAILLARTRFQAGGSNSVSKAQIPTENSAEFNALCRVIKGQRRDMSINIEAAMRWDIGQCVTWSPCHWFFGSAAHEFTPMQ
ncbi:GL19706 [Drosophila persimilis]|uniref:GL19706 n=1 Tax=Drosophila persimilis TaxID=7234 RepID=B4IRS7_DROPE|nr:GL19706 [Drosophila persimilis]